MMNKKLFSVISTLILAGLFLSTCSLFEFDNNNDFGDNDNDWGHNNYITLSGTINVTCDGKPVPYVEIEIKSTEGWLIGRTDLDSPGANAPWSITLMEFNSSTPISVQVWGYQDSSKNRPQLFVFEQDFPSKIVHKSNVSGININAGNQYNGYEPNNSTTFAENSWVEGEIENSGDAVWYSIDTSIGTTYYIRWNGLGDNTLQYIDIYAYDNNGNLIFFQNYDWSYKKASFTASTTRVYIKVKARNEIGLFNTDTGTYSIYYSKNSAIKYTVTLNANGGTFNSEVGGGTIATKTGDEDTTVFLYNEPQISRSGYSFGGWNTKQDGTGTKCSDIYLVTSDITLYAKWNIAGSEENPLPLNPNTWTDGEITASTTAGAIWYTFHVSSGSNYYFWCNDGNYYSGDGTKTLDVDVTAYYSNGTTIFTNTNAGDNYTNYMTFKANSTTSVKLKVVPTISGKTGTFSIAYNTSGYRPGAVGTEITPILIGTNGTWVNGEITSTTINGEIWYYFNIISGATYYVWWNDLSSNGKTLNVKVDGYYDDGSTAFKDNSNDFTDDNAWDTPKQIQVNSSNHSTRIKMRVYPRSTSSLLNTGTFAIVCNTNSTRP